MNADSGPADQQPTPDDDTDYLIEVMAYEALAKLATPAK